MKDALVKKLRIALSDEVNSECLVLYILAEARKLLETYPPDPPLVALKIYCHWALHVDLDNPQTTLPFLKRVDDYVASVLAGSAHVVLEYRMLREFVLLDTFREQFKQFLKGYDLPAAVCEKDAHWHNFLKHYAGVIEDGSLSCRAKNSGLNQVQEVTFNKGKPTNSDAYLPFDLFWNILLLDGRTMIVEVSAGQWMGGGIEGIIHGISLR